MKKPDYDDPFAPDPNSTKQVRCLHCNELFLEKEIRWEEKDELWVCKFWPKCNGKGMGIDIHHVDE